MNTKNVIETGNLTKIYRRYVKKEGIKGRIASLFNACMHHSLWHKDRRRFRRMENVYAYLFWLVLMMILYYNMEVLIRSMSFFILSNARLEQLEDACLDLCMKLPGIAFYGIFKLIFYCLLPYGIMATLPVQSIIGEMTWKSAVWGVMVVLAFSLFTCLVWTRGIRHYNSASS